MKPSKHHYEEITFKKLHFPFPFLPLLTQKCHGEALLLDIFGLHRSKANVGSLIK